MIHKILVVDDNFHTVRVIEALLREEELVPISAYTAEDGLRLAQTEQPSLALLDVMVPQMGGWELCRRIRDFSELPIIFLTALSEVDNVVRGLELGADDYIVKPFNQLELVARIRAHLRRSEMAPSSPRMSFNDEALVIDLPTRTVQVDGLEVPLTPREFDLLAALARNANCVITTNDLVRQAWGLNTQDAAYNIKPYIHYLRKKIEKDPSSPRWIRTARGVGYRFVADN